MPSKNNQKPSFGQSILMGSLVATLISFALFFITMPTLNVGYTDSDLLMAVAYDQGVAPPPGYPIYLLLLSLFLHLPLPLESIAMKGHLLSAMFGSLAVGFTYASAFSLFEVVVEKGKEKISTLTRPLLAGVAAASLAVSHPFWLYSTIAEKYSLSALFVAMLSFLVVKTFTLKRQRELLLTLGLTAFTFGLAISHQPLLILLSPMIIYPWYLKKDIFSLKTSAIAVIPFILGVLLSLALLAFLNLSQSQVSWQLAPGISGLVEYLKSSDFLGYYRTGNVPYLTPVDINQGISGITNYAKLVFTYFGWWQLLFLFFLFRYVSKKKPSVLISLALGYAALGLFLAFYMRWPSDWGLQAFVIPNYIPGFVLIPLLLWFGWYEFVIRMSRSLKVLKVIKPAPYLIAGFLVVLLAIQLVLTFPQNDLSRFDLVAKRYGHMLSQFSENALATCFSPTSCNSLLYAQAVNKQRQDVTIFPLMPQMVPKLAADPSLKGFNYTENPFLVWDVITWNVGKRPVYAVEINKNYFDFLGIEYGFLYYVPKGTFGELTRKLPETLPNVDYPHTQAWMQSKTRLWDPMLLELKSTPARDHLLNASVYLKMDRRDLAKVESTLATNLFYQYQAKEKKEITGLVQQLEQQSSQKAFTLGSSVPPSQELLEFIPKLLEGNYYTRAYITARGAVTADPTDPAAHYALAQIYLKMGDTKFAQFELENTLKLDPNHQEALETLQTLR